MHSSHGIETIPGVPHTASLWTSQFGLSLLPVSRGTSELSKSSSNEFSILVCQKLLLKFLNSVISCPERCKSSTFVFFFFSCLMVEHNTAIPWELAEPTRWEQPIEDLDPKHNKQNDPADS